MNFDKLTGSCHVLFHALARGLRPYAFTYPVIEAGLGIAFVVCAAVLHLRDQNRAV